MSHLNKIKQFLFLLSVFIIQYLSLYRSYNIRLIMINPLNIKCHEFIYYINTYKHIAHTCNYIILSTQYKQLKVILKCDKIHIPNYNL